MGYGDVSPATDAGKVFFVVFIFGSLSIIGFALGVLVEAVTKSEMLLKSSEDEQSTITKSVFATLDNIIGITGRLMLLNLLILLILLSFGVLFNFFVEQMSFVNSLYWTVATTTTVGVWVPYTTVRRR